MTAAPPKQVYRIKIVKNEEAKFAFAWRIYAPGSKVALITSVNNFKTDKAAVLDATSFLSRNKKHGVVDR